MIYTSAIFDFDGTICETGDGIKKSAIYALESLGIEYDKNEDLSFFIGPPLVTTFMEHYKQDRDTADQLVLKYRERYKDTGLFESTVYPGVEDMLKLLKKEGVKIGIASSKPTNFVETLLKYFNLREYFDVVCGVTIGADTETKANIIDRCVKELNSLKEETLLIGDRFYDIEGANANNIDSVGVLWGYGTKDELEKYNATFLIEKPSDVEAIVNGLYEQTLEEDAIFDGKVVTLHRDKILQVNRRIAYRECVDHPGGVGIISLDDNDNVLLVRQYRYVYHEAILEIPAGKLEKGEDPREAGIREFREECGALAGKFESLGEIYPTPGYTNEIIRLYFATDLDFTSQDLDEGENLEVIKIKFDDLISMIMSGEIKDSKTVVAALKLKEILKK